MKLRSYAHYCSKPPAAVSSNNFARDTAASKGKIIARIVVAGAYYIL